MNLQLNVVSDWMWFLRPIFFNYWLGHWSDYSFCKNSRYRTKVLPSAKATESPRQRIPTRKCARSAKAWSLTEVETVWPPLCPHTTKYTHLSMHVSAHLYWLHCVYVRVCCKYIHVRIYEHINVFIYVHIRIYIHIRILIYIYMHMYIYIYAYMYICVYHHVYVCDLHIHACMHACMYVFVCICMYLYVYVCVCVCICISVCLYMYMYICICICISVYVYVYVCIYIYAEQKASKHQKNLSFFSFFHHFRSTIWSKETKNLEFGWLFRYQNQKKPKRTQVKPKEQTWAWDQTLSDLFFRFPEVLVVMPIL